MTTTENYDQFSINMRLTQTTELALVGILIVYIAFTPGLQVVRNLLSTPVGKAVALGLIVYVWKYVSALIALLLVVSFVRCASMREGVDSTLTPPPEMKCPEGSAPISTKPGKCSKVGTDGSVMEVDMISSTPTPPPPSGPPPTQPAPPAMPAQHTGGAPLTVPSPPPPPPSTPPPVTESFTPDMSGGLGGAPF